MPHIEVRTALVDTKTMRSQKRVVKVVLEAGGWAEAEVFVRCCDSVVHLPSWLVNVESHDIPVIYASVILLVSSMKYIVYHYILT